MNIHPGHCGGFTSNLLIYNTALLRQQYLQEFPPFFISNDDILYPKLKLLIEPTFSWVLMETLPHFMSRGMQCMSYFPCFFNVSVSMEKGPEKYRVHSSKHILFINSLNFSWEVLHQNEALKNIKNKFCLQCQMTYFEGSSKDVSNISLKKCRIFSILDATNIFSIYESLQL